jgi:hypothetical protein
MATDVIQEKRQIHALIERLAPSQVRAVRGLLEVMVDPVARSIANAPIDDEPLTPEEEQALDRAEAWLKDNKGIPHEEVLAEFGLTMSDFPLKQSGA